MKRERDYKRYLNLVIGNDQLSMCPPRQTLAIGVGFLVWCLFSVLLFAYLHNRFPPRTARDAGFWAHSRNKLDPIIIVLPSVAVGVVAGKPFDEIFVFRFSPDGLHYTYIARLGETTRVVTDGKEGKPYDGIEWFDLYFSPNSKHVGYIARTGRYDSDDRSAVVVIDGQEGKRYGRIAGLLSDTPSRFHVLARRKDAFIRIEGQILAQPN